MKMLEMCLRLPLSAHTVLMYTVHNMCIFCMHTIGAILLCLQRIGCRKTASHDSMQLNLAFFQCNELIDLEVKYDSLFWVQFEQNICVLLIVADCENC